MSSEKTKDNSIYNFSGRLKREFPSQIIMDISEVCNLACIHCPHPDFKNSEHYDGRFLLPELNSKMVEEVKAFGSGCTQYIRYTSNGEPLTHPNAYDMIQEAVDHSGVFVTLTTNGKIMNEKRTQKLLDSGVHLIDISIDAFSEETYAKIRVNGDLRVTRDNVLRLLRWVRESKSKTIVVVSFVEQPINTHEMKDFRDYWISQGVSHVVLRRQHTHSGAVIKFPSEHQATSSLSTRRPCLYPWERITINARGDLSFCPSDWIHGSYIEDYRKTTIAEQWRGDFYHRLREAHLSNDFENHKFCGHCPDWSQTRWPHEGNSYANMIENYIGASKF